MAATFYIKHHRLLVAVNCIVFGFDGKDLKALLVKRTLEPEKDKWSLMGGFVRKNENVDAAARRVLDTLTGLGDVYTEQLHCFGDVNRDSAGRVISVAYFALIRIDDYKESLMKEHKARWFHLDQVPSLIFDHKQMIKVAKEKLRQKAISHPVGFSLLPNKFTLQQLLNLYEAIYETSFDKRNFTKRILSLHILRKLDEKEKQSSKKGAFLFVFNEKYYRRLEKEGIKFL